jgi:hypothetical protein
MTAPPLSSLTLPSPLSYSASIAAIPPPSTIPAQLQPTPTHLHLHNPAPIPVQLPLMPLCAGPTSTDAPALLQGPSTRECVVAEAASHQLALHAAQLHGSSHQGQTASQDRARMSSPCEKFRHSQGGEQCSSQQHIPQPQPTPSPSAPPHHTVTEQLYQQHPPTTPLPDRKRPASPSPPNLLQQHHKLCKQNDRTFAPPEYHGCVINQKSCNQHSTDSDRTTHEEPMDVVIEEQLVASL